MDKPVWIEYIIKSSQAYESFVEFCDEQRRLKVDEIIALTRSGNHSEAASVVGHVEFIDTMKNQVEMYRKEENENALQREINERYH